jgi:ribosomal protein S12 methylthiotransferase accessory factor
MRKNINIIYSLFDALTEKEIITEIRKSTHFYDEPQFFYYAASINQKYMKKKVDIRGAGLSLFSADKALLKCLAESAERFSLINCPINKIVFASYSDSKLRKKALDPIIYTCNRKIRSRRIGWIRGYNLTKSLECFLPAQLIYQNYDARKDGINLSDNVSTGAAGGFDHESTLCRGIYEIIERDCFMTIYLAQIKIPRIDIDIIRDEKIQKINSAYIRYNLDVYVFNITNDLSIPSFLTILIDKSNQGPPLALGLKSSLNAFQAIYGSMEEAFLTRPWIRQLMLDKQIKQITKKPNLISSHLERAAYWMQPNMLEKLDFLLKQPVVPLHLSYYKNTQSKLGSDKIIHLLKQIDYQIYFCDITPDFLQEIGFKTYKVIIPGLQPLYLREKNKLVIKDRLLRISKFFGQKIISINTIPHPFL